MIIISISIPRLFIVRCSHFSPSCRHNKIELFIREGKRSLAKLYGYWKRYWGEYERTTSFLLFLFLLPIPLNGLSFFCFGVFFDIETSWSDVFPISTLAMTITITTPTRTRMITVIITILIIIIITIIVITLPLIPFVKYSPTTTCFFRY